MIDIGNKLVVANAGWADTIPDWLKKEVATERVALSFGDIENGKEDEKVGDAEVCLYLFTASLTAPMSHEWNQIYAYLGAKLMGRQNGGELPTFLQGKLDNGLEPDAEREFERLKGELWKKRGGRIKSPLIDALRALSKEV